MIVFQSIWVDLYNYVIQKLFPKMNVLECMYIKQALDVLEGLLPPQEERKDIRHDNVVKYIIFSVMWSLGAILELDDRKKVKPLSI